MRYFRNRLRAFALVCGALLGFWTGIGRVYAAAGPDEHEMDAHMKMTSPRPKQPGDQARAEAIVAGARKAAERYSDYHHALDDGYNIFMPDQTQKVYHFLLERGGADSGAAFDAAKPPALLYEKTEGAMPGYRFIGVMYTARYGASEAELNERVPLSVGQWHEHLNLCAPPDAGQRNWLLGDARFGLDGAIATKAACDAAGGRFLPHLGGWMVHVYPLEKDPAKVWSAEMDDFHGAGKAMPGMER